MYKDKMRYCKRHAQNLKQGMVEDNKFRKEPLSEDYINRYVDQSYRHCQQVVMEMTDEQWNSVKWRIK